MEMHAMVKVYQAGQYVTAAIDAIATRRATLHEREIAPRRVIWTKHLMKKHPPKPGVRNGVPDLSRRSALHSR
jgi:hypothetical protein